MPSRRPSASGRPEAAPSPAALFAALPAGFQTVAVDFTAGPFARLTYAYPARPPARLDLAVLPVPMRQEVAYWLHTLAVAGERVNSRALAEWVRIAAAVAAATGISSFTGLGVEEWVAAARRRYHDRHHRLPPPSYQHNHRAAIARLHAALTLACQAGQPWWRSPVRDPRHDRRIPVREHEPLEGQRLNFTRVSPGWLREAIQWYFAAGLSTGLLSWSSLPGFLSYLGRHFAAFLAAEGIDTPDLGAGPEAGIRPVAVRLAAWLRQQRTRSGCPLAPSAIGLIQTTVAGFYAFMADRRAVKRVGVPALAGALAKAVSGPSTLEVSAAAALSGDGSLEARVAQLETGRVPPAAPLDRRRLALSGISALALGGTMAAATMGLGPLVARICHCG